MPVLARYLELLATAHFFAADRGVFWSEERAFYWARKTVMFVPMVHAGLMLGLLHLVSRLTGATYLAGKIPRLLVLVIFAAAIVFLYLDDDYLLNLRDRIRLDSPAARASRQREVRAFVRNTYLAAAAIALAEIGVYLWSLSG